MLGKLCHEVASDSRAGRRQGKAIASSLRNVCRPKIRATADSSTRASL